MRKAAADAKATDPKPQDTRRFQAAGEDAGKRLDVFLVEKLDGASRARIQELIAGGHIRVNGETARASLRLRGGEAAEVTWQPRPPLRAFAEDLPLTVLYQDDEIIVVDKPAGMPVHAGAGRDAGTLVNALLHQFGPLSGGAGDLRPGIVHRLDRLTSGVLVVARSDEAHQALGAQFQAREVGKTYIALVHGNVAEERGRFDAPIARDLARRHRMTARRRSGRQALTEYRVVRRFARHTLLEVRIHTGRTHQIRVHLSTAGHPVVGDTTYGAPGGVIERYFLHAARLAFRHPRTGVPLEFSAPLPADLAAFLDSLTA